MPIKVCQSEKEANDFIAKIGEQNIVGISTAASETTSSHLGHEVHHYVTILYSKQPQEEVVLVKKRVSEVLKVWYALFATIMDEGLDDSLMMDQLRHLRAKLKAEAPELEKKT